MTSYSEIALVRNLSRLAESQQVLSNNLANVGTHGFKRSAAISEPDAQQFHGMLQAELPVPSFRHSVDFRAGELETTGNQLDLALEGDGFFRVRDGAGREFLTRGGQATLDSQGRLVTSSGMRFLDTNGLEVAIGGPEGIPSQILISPAGTISDGKVNGQQWGPLAIQGVEDPNLLKPVGAGLYVEPQGVRARLDPTTQVHQGAVERSNVETVDELVRMIGVQRSFQGNQKALTTIARMRAEYVQTINR